MRFEDEKDYIMRMIKEMVSVLFSILLGKQYVSVDEERKNGYEVSGTDLNDLLDMIDNGQINEAENLMLDDIDYSDKKELAAAIQELRRCGEALINTAAALSKASETEKGKQPETEHKQLPC